MTQTSYFVQLLVVFGAEKSVPQNEGVPGVGILPVLEWEEPTARVALPESLQEILKWPVLFLRVSKSKHKIIQSEHSRDIAQYLALSDNLINWERVGSRPSTNNWSVYFRVNLRWHIAIMGPDRSGSFNLITHWSTNDE